MFVLLILQNACLQRNKTTSFMWQKPLWTLNWLELLRSEHKNWQLVLGQVTSRYCSTNILFVLKQERRWKLFRSKGSAECAAHCVRLRVTWREYGEAVSIRWSEIIRKFTALGGLLSYYTARFLQKSEKTAMKLHEGCWADETNMLVLRVEVHWFFSSPCLFK